MNEKNKQQLEEIVKKMLEHMGIKASVSIATDAIDEKNSLVVEIETDDDSKFLIGKYGINLNAFQHLCRLIARKKIEEEINFSIDVNNYHQKQKEKIIQLATESIEKVIHTGEKIELPPMNAYERRLVHMEVAKNNNLKSESTGEDMERKVIIELA